MTRQCLSGKDLRLCGQQLNFRQDKSGKLVLEKEESAGIFISQTYDSGQDGAEWNRVVMDISGNAVFQVCVYLFDDYAEGEKIEHRNGVQEQYDALKEKAQYISNYREMLLYGAKQGKGRFARLAVEVVAEANQGRRTVTDASCQEVSLKGYAMSFPKESFAQYLPAIYQGNGQLDRFLAVQQSIYLELEQGIDRLACGLDYELCEKEQISLLAKWLGWGGLAEIAKQDVIRQLLGTGLYLISRKGSREYYVKLAEILTGQEAVLLEETDKGHSLLLVKSQPENGREKYLKWLRRNVPVGVKMDIEILHRTCRLGGSFFLDHTASLAGYGSGCTANSTGAQYKLK